jgi:hypothetical protein
MNFGTSRLTSMRISHFPIEQRTGSSRLFGGTKNKQYAEYGILEVNLVPRACDPREGTRGSGIIRFREESDWPLKWNA